MKIVIVFIFLIAHQANTEDYGRSNFQNIPKASRLFGVKGGNIINIAKRPYTVAVLDNEYLFLGGGVLVSKSWVLTAAAVVQNHKAKNVIIRVGTGDAIAGGAAVPATHVVLHPNFHGNWTYDIALVKLKYPIIIGELTKPIPLSKTLPEEGADTVVSGYGGIWFARVTDAYLRDVTVPFIPYKKCKRNYRAYKHTFTPLSFCASKENVGPCPLDWGDPLVYKNKLIGIFSGCYEKCGSTKYPAAYADITKYRKWIKNIIRH